MKKIAISLSIVLFAIFFFFYLQLQQAKTLVVEQLARRDIKLEAVSLNFFPHLSISLEQVKYHAVSVKKIEGKLSFFSFIFGNPMLDEIQIQQASFTENALNSANIRMAFSDFPLKQFLRKDLILNGTHHVWVTLEKPVYGNATTFDFIFNKGNIALRQKGESLIQFDDVQLNQQKLGYIEIHADLTKPQKLAIAYIRPTCATNCLAILKFNSYLQKSVVNFSGKNFPLKQLLALLNFPQTMTGTSDFNTQLAFTNSELIEGKFDFNARDGELLGLNLLDMAAQYLPINYNSDLTASRNMNTKYKLNIDKNFRHQLKELIKEKLK